MAPVLAKSILMLLVVGMTSLLALGLWVSFSTLPPVFGGPPARFGKYGNWIGQGGAIPFVWAAILVVAIYPAKYFVIKNQRSVLLACLTYCGLIALSLPYMWFLVVMDWRNRHVYPIACWADPFAMWFIPTVSFCFDCCGKSTTDSLPRPLTYISRSLLECILLPIWLYFWAFLSLVLGWAWI
jgi:hypothetical protein